MVGCSALLAIDQRLRQAPIILFGDLGQLPPVGDSPLFMVRAGLRSVQGHVCYRSFAQAFVLSALVRQSADDVFRDLLVHLRNGESLQDDYQLLCGRFVARVDQGDFAHAVRLFAVKRLVEEHNLLMLCSLGRPIAVIKGVQGRPAGGLESGLDLCCALICGLARVLLTVASVRFRTSSICRASRHPLCRILSCAHFRSILGPLSFQHCHTPCRLFPLRVSGIPGTALSHEHNLRCVSHTQLPCLKPAFPGVARLAIIPLPSLKETAYTFTKNKI